MGWTGRRLADLLDMPLSVYALEFERVNLLNDPGQERWTRATEIRYTGRATDLLLSHQFAERPGILFLGRVVGEAFGFKPTVAVQFESPFLGCPIAMCIPHPSGLNRYYNDPRQREYVRNMLGFFKSKVLQCSPSAKPPTSSSSSSYSLSPAASPSAST